MSGRPLGRRLRVTVLEDDAATHQPVAVVDTAGEAPAARDAELLAGGHRLPLGANTPAGDAQLGPPKTSAAAASSR